MLSSTSRRIVAAARPLLAARQFAVSSASLSADKPTVTVCGGGNAAHVAAGMFSNQGADVNLFFSFEDEANRFREGCEANDGVTVITKQETYKGKPKVITHDAEEAVTGSDLVLIITPAFAHESILGELKDHLKEGSFVGAIPGPGGFDLIGRSALGETLKEKNITLFGGSSLPWACRATKYGQEVELLGEKSKVPVSMYPEGEEQRQKLEHILNFVHKHTKYHVGGHFLNCTLWCTNAIIHPGITYGIWHDWDGKPVAEQPLFYQNCNDFTGNVLKSLSNEIAACRDVIAANTSADMSVWQPIDEYLVDTYSHVISDTSSVAKIFATNDAFRGLTAPCITLEDGTFMPNFNTRYLTEDLPHGLAVLRGIAEICGVESPMMDEVLTWTQEKVNLQYLVDGKICGPDVAKSGCPQRFGIKTVQELVAA